MPAQQPNGHGTNGTSETDAARQERGGSIVELITEAEELRTVMLEASARLTRLLSGLKQHRRQSRAVQAAMPTVAPKAAPANDAAPEEVASHPPGCNCAVHLAYRKKAARA